MYRIGVIVRPKKTDALICQLLAQYVRLEIAEYGVPQADWLSWIMKRLRTAGFLVLIGHLELSLFIKLQQCIERLSGRTIWKRYGIPQPQWTDLTKAVCKNEQSLKDRFKDVDAVMALDAFRLSQSFFRGLHVPYFEVSWGDATKYLGDSAAFWEYALGNKKTSTVSIIERNSYFQKISIVSQITVNTISVHETLRSLKVKQATELSLKLPAVLRDIVARVPRQNEWTEEKKIIRQCYAPTFWTYMKYRLCGLNSLPRYACRSKDMILKMPPSLSYDQKIQ